jgi:hypothetical protein
MQLEIEREAIREDNRDHEVAVQRDEAEFRKRDKRDIVESPAKSRPDRDPKPKEAIECSSWKPSRPSARGDYACGSSCATVRQIQKPRPS